MPAPPRKNEERRVFMSRCVSHIVNKEGKSKDQAVAICFSMWRKKHGTKGENSADPTMAKLIDMLTLED